MTTKPEPGRGRGRPAIMLVCLTCSEREGCTVEKKTSEFPAQRTAGVLNRCLVCTKLATATTREARATTIVAKRAAKDEKRATTAERRAERVEARRIEKLAASPEVHEFKREYEARLASDKAADAVSAFFASIYVPYCGCCHELSAMRDSVGDQPWCLLCGWGIERTGKCLAHPGGRVFYEGMPSSEGLVLPPELIATMRAPPAPPQEQPDAEPDQDPPEAPTEPEDT